VSDDDEYEVVPTGDVGEGGEKEGKRVEETTEGGDAADWGGLDPEAVRTLAGMGFAYTERLANALRRNPGDINKVVEELLDPV
jgi:hypothetical protein